MRVVAQLFGVPEHVLPPTLRAFRCDERAMLEGDSLTVGADALAVANTVLHPRAPLALLPALRALRVPAIGLLPREIRDRYGFAWRVGAEYSVSPGRQLIRSAERTSQSSVAKSGAIRCSRARARTRCM
jgi:uncharacterized protein (DUF2236 family)